MPWICPECGEKAIAARPQDLTPSQKPNPQEHAHSDGTQLCPVMGRDGYEPAVARHR